LGAGAFVLPQLITAAQDMWHAGSDTWFDRSTDLRVLLNGGAAPVNAKYADGQPGSPNITPAVWVRGAGNWLDRDDSEHVTAFGKDFRFNLNRDLETIDFQSGIDLGKRGLFSDNDILVFGALGGFIHSDLDYDAINRLFSFDGGQVGGYATYLRDPAQRPSHAARDQDLGLPQLSRRHHCRRQDRLWLPLRLVRPWRLHRAAGHHLHQLGGYRRLQSRRQQGVVQRRSQRQRPLGLTRRYLDAGMDPFVIGSLWGNLSDDNEATLVSTGTSFHLEDNLQDVWGEASAGVNFFNPSANTSVFAKLVTFGEDIEGVGGKAGMRVSW
jgi:hypothetical protein